MARPAEMWLRREWSRGAAVIAVVVVCVGALPFTARGGADNPRPMTGRCARGWEPLDEIMHEFMDRTGFQAGTLTVVDNGRWIYARGFGWSDAEKTVPTDRKTPMRLASCTKPFTAAAVRNLIRSRKIATEMRVIEYLEIPTPPEGLADPRVKDITVGHLLGHRSGLGGGFSKATVKKQLGLEREVDVREVLEFVFAHKQLAFTPGAKYAYSNYGYRVLARVIEKATGLSYEAAVQKLVCRPLGVKDVRLSGGDPDARLPAEVHYDNRLDTSFNDGSGGLIASGRSLCRFMNAYWINGARRTKRTGKWYIFYGRHSNVTAIMQQRKDGVNLAILFNGGRKNYKADNDYLRQRVNDTISAIRKTQE